MQYDWLATGLAGVGNPFSGSGLSPSISANRVSYVFGMEGPSVLTDTACSASLVVVDTVTSYVRQRDCTSGLAGGTSMLISPYAYAANCVARMLSIVGRCFTFDEAADGFTRAEGSGVAIFVGTEEDSCASGHSALA